MNLEFKNESGNCFSLGTVSFDVLDKSDIFDKYQEDHDQYSKIIFSCKNLGNLHTDILSVLIPEIRKDIKEKLKLFSKFVKNSNKLTAEVK